MEEVITETRYDEVGEQLEALRGNDGVLHVDDVIGWAQEHKDSALGRQYNWDVEEAAFEHWRQRTRQLIRLHIVHPVSRQREVVSLQIDQIKGGGYRKLDDVLNSPRLTEFLLQDAIQELWRVYQKYQHFTELAGVGREIDLIISRVFAKVAAE
jgi:hypothetical protein